MASESGVSSTGGDDHVTQNEVRVIDLDEDSDEDTAGERGDILPHDSTSTTTTDAVNDPVEPIDFIESRPQNHTHCFNGAIGPGRSVLPTPSNIHYENWSILVEMEENSRKGGFASSN